MDHFGLHRLGAARARGILAGERATSNKGLFSLAVEQDPSVEWVGRARWVESGKILTSSGVSAGTDMALGLIALLYDKARAEQVAASIEYVWNDDPDNDPFAIDEPATGGEGTVTPDQPTWPTRLGALIRGWFSRLRER